MFVTHTFGKEKTGPLFTGTLRHASKVLFVGQDMTITSLVFEFWAAVQPLVRDIGAKQNGYLSMRKSILIWA